ncbi:MAG: NAD(P)H-hydrate dehydratase [Clostridia bacterium]|nr:NAD(P)H-hydrate dehydratase [Clostridia bacterium]
MNETIITKEYIKTLVGTRKKDSHKGDNGKGLLIAGSDGFFGAAVMATASALRSGIGTLKTASLNMHRQAFMALSEAMFCAVGESWDDCNIQYIDMLISDADVIGFGPGIGKSSGVGVVLEKVIDSKKNIVIDADGLNVLAKSEKLKASLSDNIVLTPHMGEMSRLSGIKTEELCENPMQAAIFYAKKWQCNILLKGAETFIASPDGRCMKNISGNAGLAKGGSGDILTGIILAMMGQKLNPFDAACAGSYILGASADNAFDILKERMLMARDVIEAIEETLTWKQHS